MNRFLFSAAAIVGLFASQSGWGATQTATMAASSTVQTVCSLNTTPLAFPAVAVTGVTDVTSTVNVTCTNGGAYNVGLDSGLNGVAGQRNLKSGTNTLAYGLFSDAAHATAWGNTVGTDTIAGTGNGAVQALTVYGEIAAGQTLTTGSYTDTVQVTVTY
jgi:spore coat protein U-like protein